MRRRRIRALAALLAACAVAAWLAAPALTARPFVPRAVEFSQALDARAFERDGRRWRSPALRAPRRFDLVGLRWRDGRHGASIRVRDGAGRWSRWTEMARDHGRGGGAELVWTGGADAFQLRLDGRPRGLRARFVNVTGSAGAWARARTALSRAAHGALAALAGIGPAARAQVSAGAQARGAPAIVPRAAWAGDQCEPRAQPAYGEVRMGFVHHTVSANGYGPHESAAIVLAICRYHRDSNGWHDIGYNFLVDRYGQIFEGRAGGVDQPVIGAQAQGYNSHSTGVANIGTFALEPQAPAGVAATAELLAWKLSLHGAPVAGTVAVRSGGGASNRFPAGAEAAFERIAAHRDGDRTTCPGDGLFAQLPEIRRQAAALAPLFGQGPPRDALTLQALERRIEHPRAALVSGRATDAAGRALAGLAVAVQLQLGDGRWSTRARARTGADGSWQAELATAYSRTVRAVAALPGGGEARSERLTVEVAPRLRLRAPARARLRRALTVRGSISPRRSRVTIEVARRGADRRWHTVARVRATARRGRFSARLRLRRSGTTRLRARFAGDRRNAPARSDARRVHVSRR